MKVHAVDSDSGDNGLITYSLVYPVLGIDIDKSNGVLVVNQTLLNKEFFHKVRIYYILH